MSDKDLPRLDRTALSVVPLEESDNDVAYWRSRTPEERLTAIEHMRWMVYGKDRATQRLQRVFEFDELKRG